jgi:hypothetical protein
MEIRMKHADQYKIEGFEEALDDFLRLSCDDLKDLNPHYNDPITPVEKSPKTEGRRTKRDVLKSSHANR